MKTGIVSLPRNFLVKFFGLPEYLCVTPLPSTGPIPR